MEKPKMLVQNAASCLSAAAYNPRKFTAIHAGVALGFSLLVTVLNFILTQGIGTTSGLSGLGLRSVLETMQTVLQFAVMLLMPFWQIGYMGSALNMSRKEAFGPGMLLDGFKRFFAVIMLLFAQSALLLLLGFACFYICSGIFTYTPLAQPFFEAVEPILSEANLMSGSNLILDEATLAAAVDALIPMLILFLVAYVAVSIPFYYRFRMADFVLMDYPQLTGIKALGASVRMMRGISMDLFRLDLQFWWFYVLQALVTLLGYGDLILSIFGIEIFSNPDVAYFLFYLLYVAAEFALLVWAKAHIQTSYALFYEAAKGRISLPRNEAPEKQNWNY